MKTEEHDTQVEPTEFQDESPIVHAYEEANEIISTMKELNRLIQKYGDNKLIVDPLKDALRTVQSLAFSKLLQEHSALAEIIEKE